MMSPADMTLRAKFRDGTICGQDLAAYARAKGRPFSDADAREFDQALAEFRAECAATSAAERFLASLKAFQLPS